LQILDAKAVVAHGCSSSRVLLSRVFLYQLHRGVRFRRTPFRDNGAAFAAARARASELVAADHLAVHTGGQLHERLQGDAVAEEADAAVTHADVGAAGVEGVDLALVGAVDPAGARDVSRVGQRVAGAVRAVDGD